MPWNWRFSPSVSVSPILKFPCRTGRSRRRECLVDDALALAQEAGRAVEADVLVQPHVVELLVPLEAARADAQEGNAVAVAGSRFAWILKTKPVKLFSSGATSGRWTACRAAGRDAREGVEEFLDAEVVDGAAEEHRRQFAVEILSTLNGS